MDNSFDFMGMFDDILGRKISQPAKWEPTMWLRIKAGTLQQKYISHSTKEFKWTDVEKVN